MSKARTKARRANRLSEGFRLSRTADGIKVWIPHDRLSDDQARELGERLMEFAGSETSTAMWA